MAYLNHNIPVLTCFIRNEYLYNHESGHGDFTLADVHSVASVEKRVPLFEAFLENGVNWTRRPINAFCWKKEAPVYPLTYHMFWDSFSPYIAKQWVDWLVADINEHMRSQEVIKAEKSLKFLNEQANKTNVSEIKNVISELIKSDIQTLTLSSSSDEYIFKTIDKAIVPEFKFSPKRAYICIAISLFGGFLSIIFAFILEYIRNSKFLK